MNNYLAPRHQNRRHATVGPNGIVRVPLDFPRPLRFSNQLRIIGSKTKVWESITRSNE